MLAVSVDAAAFLHTDGSAAYMTRHEGSVLCSRISAPADSDVGFTQVGVGDGHAIFLAGHGKVVVFDHSGGLPTRAPSTLPDPNRFLRHDLYWSHIAAGPRQWAMVRSDGVGFVIYIDAWLAARGDEEVWQSRPGIDFISGAEGPCRFVAAGRHHSVFLGDTGTAVGLGSNCFGQSSFLRTPSPRGDSAIVACAAGAGHTVLLRRDGSVCAVGSNGHGECRLPPIPLGRRAVSAAAGYEFSLILLDDGQTLSAGRISLPKDWFPLGGLRTIAAGGNTAAALTCDGRLVGSTNFPRWCCPPPSAGFLGAPPPVILAASLTDGWLQFHTLGGTLAGSVRLGVGHSLSRLRACLSTMLPRARAHFDVVLLRLGPLSALPTDTYFVPDDEHGIRVS